MRRALSLLALLLVGACSSGSSEPTPTSIASRITVSPHVGLPPTPVLNALYLRMLDERLALRHSRADDALLYAAARATCAGWAAGMDFDGVLRTLPPWSGWQDWQQAWLAYAATTTYCPQFAGRLPHKTGRRDHGP